ncbi:MAG: UDP-glucose 4-epimerase GalE [Candidatus Dojkabacteria bacterium]
MKILVSGGAGYIGSHTVFKLIETGHEVAVFDNLEYGHREAIDIIQEITESSVRFYLGNLLNYEDIEYAIEDSQPDAIVHFAAYAYVGESVTDPVKYYQNNISGGVNLLKAMQTHNVDKIVFSSTCAIFGQPDTLPISENLPKKPINPYGRSKLMFEQILGDADKAYGIKNVCLRYFNAAGAEPRGFLGEDHDPETHLIPLVINTALGKRESISIFGTDYDTEDGTCIRDYIHVLDLADAHVKAVEYLETTMKSEKINLGTGKGASVKEIIVSVKELTEKLIMVREEPRREGDPAVLVADNARAKQILGWEPVYSLDDMLSHAVKWHMTKDTFEY